MILENYTREQFREWLHINHKTEKEVFIVVDRRTHSFLLKNYVKKSTRTKKKNPSTSIIIVREEALLI